MREESTYKNLTRDLRSYATPERAEVSTSFFKTRKGEYGGGDIFIGVTMPDLRKVAKIYPDLDLSDIKKLLKSTIHEERLAALIILVDQYKKGRPKQKKMIYSFYLSHTRSVNNWDLVDSSAHQIVGEYLSDKNKKILEKLARSKNLWERRIAIVATFAFISRGEDEWTFRISALLMNDPHDLIHKACGWMQREAGKRVSEDNLCGFLDMYAPSMPRTMLRYAIERFSPSQRSAYLKIIKK
ncbi:MAG: DNA alkylation repair protein [Patescibacteria group bacterium]